MKTSWMNGELFVLLTQKPTSWSEIDAAIQRVLDESGTPDAKVRLCPAW